MNQNQRVYSIIQSPLRLLEREPELVPLVRPVLYMAPHWQPVLDDIDCISRGAPAATSSTSSLLLVAAAPLPPQTNPHNVIITSPGSFSCPWTVQDSALLPLFYYITCYILLVFVTCFYLIFTKTFIY